MAPAATPDGIRFGFRTRWLSEERLRFMRQVGAEEVFVDVIAPGHEADAYADDLASDRDVEHLRLAPDDVPSVDRLETLKAHVEGTGLRLAGIHSLHFGMYGDIMFDRAGKEQQLEAVGTLIDRLGAAGIDTLGYQWNPRGLVLMRTATAAPVRGGATATAFDEADLDPIETPPGDLDRTYTAEECWEYYEGFLETVLPRAEDAGVRLALHPADPPVYEELGGVPRLFGTRESFDRALAAVPSDAHGLKLCLGCFSEMGEDIPDVIRHFGDDLVFVHFRDVIGTVPAFTETFLDEGNFDEFAAMEALHDVGFDGPVLLDHVPELAGDTEWRHRSRAYGAGYLRCLINWTERR